MTIIAAILFIWGVAAHSAPSVFVKSETNGAWWNGAMTARILGQSAGLITVEKLSNYIAETMLYYPYSVCSLEPASSGTFVGIDRSTQKGIDEYKPLAGWKAESVAPDGRRVLGQSVVFEGCEADDPRGGALLVTDATTGEILHWRPTGSYTDKAGHKIPIWVMFLDPKAEDGNELFSTSLCRECGDRTYIYYDISRRHVYSEHNGH